MDDTIISACSGNKNERTNQADVMNLSCYIAGKAIESDKLLEIRSPYDNRLVGTVKLANASHAQLAIEAALKGGAKINKIRPL